MKVNGTDASLEECLVMGNDEEIVFKGVRYLPEKPSAPPEPIQYAPAEPPTRDELIQICRDAIVP